MKYLFYDTNALLSQQEKVFETDDIFYISSITLNELENIKTSSYKDEEIKYSARQILHLLQDNKDKYKVILYYATDKEYLDKYSLVDNNDSKIIVCAIKAYQDLKDKGFYFVTQDLACKTIADAIHLPTKFLDEEELDDYTGFYTVDFETKNDDLIDFYSTIISCNKNKYNLYENQYLLISVEGAIIDKYKWTNNHYEQINFCKTQSKMFGKIVPKDAYQMIALDSMKSNKITMIRGAAGSGKSYLSFGYMFDLLESGKIDKIIIFCNTVSTKGSAKLGFYPGTRTEKLLDSQIGNLLESKIGDRGAVEKLIDDGSIVLLPMSDIRGYDTTGMNAAIYISEAQNLDRELMKLALQRIGEDSICIIDGDSNAQVDLSMYAGSHNGMRRVSKIFRGSDIYGEVTLQKIHRSKIAELAQQI